MTIQASCTRTLLLVRCLSLFCAAAGGQSTRFSRGWLQRWYESTNNRQLQNGNARLAPSTSLTLQSTGNETAAGNNEVILLLQDLNRQLDGTIIFANNKKYGDNGWSEDRLHRLTWIQPAPVPLAIVQVASEQDVSRAVPVLAQLDHRFGVPFRIKSGGHHYHGYSSVGQGVVLDLAKLNSIDIEPRLLAWLGPAVRGGDIWKQLIRKHKLGAIMGGCPAVNVGGFILGGGFSYWSRLYGLGCDRLVQARVVLANGTIITANATNEHSGLFWALRGAGSAGVGGVVTRLQVELFPTQDAQVYGMGKIPTVEQAAHYLSAIGKLKLPGQAGLTLFLFPKKFFGEDFISLYNWYDNGMDQLEEGLSFLNETFHQVLGTETARNFTLEIKSGTDHSKGGIMEGRLWQVWNGFLMPGRSTPKIWKKLLRLLKDIRDQGEEYVTVEILLWGGAISEKQPDETAFYWRRGLFNICVNLGVPAHVENAEAIFERKRAFLDQAWSKVERFLDGAYYNYPVQGRAGTPQGYFGKNRHRLKRIKKTYDPDNVFHHPQSI